LLSGHRKKHPSLEISDATKYLANAEINLASKKNISTFFRDLILDRQLPSEKLQSSTIKFC